MAKVFRNSSSESRILSRIESSKERERVQSLNMVRDYYETLSNSISMKLVETELIETTNKNGLQDQLSQCLGEVPRLHDFDIDYKIAPYRTLVANPNIISLYLTAFVLENLIDHKDIIDVYGSDEDIYHCIHEQVKRYLEKMR